MEIFKGTKGPWAWQGFGENKCLTAQHGLREIIIASNRVSEEEGDYRSEVTMNKGGVLRKIDPDHPNAKLIAAAPELLEACDLLVQAYDKGMIGLPTSLLLAIKQAIDKAIE